MICFPNAKINLGLNIVGKRPDGYHNIETVFYPIPVADALEVVPATQLSFHQTGIKVDAPAEKNLVMKAFRLIRSLYEIPEMEIHLLKKIPFGAGLGGGSADAAWMLKLLNEFCSLGLSIARLEELAGCLGADCPFFIRNKPVFATGTGNLFEEISLSLKGYYLCLIKPNICVSTQEAYAKVVPLQPEVSLKQIVSQPVEDWRYQMVNDFETSVFAKHPLIGDIKTSLYKAGASYAAMSGSGSSVFGLFDHAVSLKETFAGCFVWEGILA